MSFLLHLRYCELPHVLLLHLPLPLLRMPLPLPLCLWLSDAHLSSVADRPMYLVCKEHVDMEQAGKVKSY